jgi:type II secretory pathway pseudopilin PulG
MREDGFSLIEVLIASMLVIVALASLAQLFVVAMSANRHAKSVTVATILAREKSEEISAIAGDGIHSSAGVADFVDAHGRNLGTGILPPPGTAYIRRWSLLPLPRQPAVSVLQVWVRPHPDTAGPDLVRLVALKPRSVWR